MTTAGSSIPVSTTRFPTAVDAFETAVIDDTVHPNIINALRRAIEALEDKVGINNSADTASLDYKVNNR